MMYIQVLKSGECNLHKDGRGAEAEQAQFQMCSQTKKEKQIPCSLQPDLQPIYQINKIFEQLPLRH